MMRSITTVMSLFALIGCAEESQSQEDARVSGDAPPYQGAQDAYTAQGWQPGDKRRWDVHMRNRAQTQNEYVKTE